ncbi:MAG: DUF1573 domain-containing protein [Cyclobacteriaceae bacterium]
MLKVVLVLMAWVSLPLIVRAQETASVEKGSVELLYPKKQGAIRSESRHLYFGHVYGDTSLVRSIILYNDSDSLISIYSASISAPEFLTIKFDSIQIPPGGHAKMLVSFDAAQSGSMGFHEWQFSFETDDPSYEEAVEFFAVANVHQRFAKVEGEGSDLPHIVFDKSKSDLGVIHEGTVMETSFEITNTGMAPLIIENVKSNCDCIVWKLNTREIQPGKTGELKVSFDTKNRKGHQYKNLTIFSNDPSASIQMLAIKAQVID